MIVQALNARGPRAESIAAMGVSAALFAGVLAAFAGPIAVAVALGVCVFCAVAWRPVSGSYLYLATLPFVAGIGRGELFPFVRPNEAILLVVVAGALAGGYLRALRGAPLRLRLNPWDEPLFAFLVLAAVWPIVSMMIRGLPPAATDIVATFPVWKLAGLYLLVRMTVSSQAHVLWCIRLIVGGSVGIAVIAVLQTMGVTAVLTLLDTWWSVDPSTGLDGRGTTTLSNAIATGDYILIGLVLLIVASLRNLIGKRTRVGAGLALTAGVLATGQFSTWVAALFVGVLLLWRVPRARASAVRVAPVLVIASLAGASAVSGRLDELITGGLPQSWLVRWDNVVNLYFPELIGDGRFFIGVSPDSVLVPPDTWRDVIYLESGYVQFLWIGGVPLLVGFLLLSWAVLTLTGRLSSRLDGVGACASALSVSWLMIMLLSVMDAHLYMRGPGDLLVVLLGIVTSKVIQEDTNNADE